MRLANRFYWIKKEIFSDQTPEAIYDDLITRGIYESSIKYQRRVKSLNKVFLQMGGDFFNILDLACGTGALIDALPWKASAEIVGLDISENMLKVAIERFKDCPNIGFKKADFMKLDFPKSSFDLITNAYATRFIPVGQEELFAKNVAELLKPNGRFVAFGDGSLRWLGNLVGLFGFRPKSYNFNMNYRQPIVRAFSEQPRTYVRGF